MKLADSCPTQYIHLLSSLGFRKDLYSTERKLNCQFQVSDSMWFTFLLIELKEFDLALQYLSCKSAIFKLESSQIKKIVDNSQGSGQLFWSLIPVTVYQINNLLQSLQLSKNTKIMQLHNATAVSTVLFPVNYCYLI